MPDHLGIVQIQLDQLVVALPGLVPEAVVVAGVSAEVHAEPVLVRTVPFLFLHIPEGPESPAHVVEHAVEHNPHSGVVKRAADPAEVLVGPQAAVQLEIVPRVIPMLIAFKQRVEEDGIRSGAFDVLHPVQNPENAAGRLPVVVFRRAAQAQGINLINH